MPQFAPAKRPASGANPVRMSSPAPALQRAPAAHAPKSGGVDLSAVPLRSGADMHQAASLGTSGPGRPLPFRDAIQKSFGRHDVSAIAAHTDSGAAAAARALGASAFATGQHVAFESNPTLHTAAHEAAHVIQQRSGLQLAGGIGGVRDVHERHADAVADRVVRGQSSEALLDVYAPKHGAPTGGSVQLKAQDSAYGTFDTVSYHALTDGADKGIGCEIYLRFTPNDKVDSTKIGLTQAAKSMTDGALALPDDKEKQVSTAGASKNFVVDQYPTSANPLYATDKPPATNAGKMGAWETPSHVKEMTAAHKASQEAGGVKGSAYEGFGQHGFRKKKGADWAVQSAQIHDRPRLPGSTDTKNVVQQFETTAVAVEGAQKGSYYGSVQWGWQRDDKKKFSLMDFKLVSMGTPSAAFLGAARQWNKSTTFTAAHAASGPTLKLPMVDVFVTTAETDVQAGADTLKLPANTRVRVVSKGAAAADPWTVEIVGGPDTSKTVSIDHTLLKRE